jgi:DNA-binding response OmpR family regulator
MTKKILVADDDDGFRYPIVNLLEDSGFEVVQATTKDEVLDCVEREQPVLWIIDARLPSAELEGIIAVRELAERAVRSPYPVIFISVLPKSFAIDKLMAVQGAGVKFEWLEKPFELQFLLTIIENYMSENR